MYQKPYYGCAGGCQNCPRLRQCLASADAAQPALKPAAAKVPAAVPVFAAEAPAPAPAPAPTAVKAENGTAWESTQEAPDLAGFLAQNPDTGSLRVQAFRGDQVLPMQGVHVTVYKDLDGQRRIFYEGDTDASGIIDRIPLPAPARSESQYPGDGDPYATYQLTVTHPQYQTQEKKVDVFQGIQTVQPIQMRLKME